MSSCRPTRTLPAPRPAGSGELAARENIQRGSVLPKNVLLHKLIYYQLSGGVSDKHIRDIIGMIKLQGQRLDRGYIADWAGKLGIAAEWAMVCRRVDQRDSDQS